MNPKKYRIETFGCQMNVHDSERMAGLLEQMGYEAAAGEGDADLVLINTCSVREKAAEKLFSRLGELRQLERAGRPPLIGVAGCVAQQEGQALLARAPNVDLVIGTQNVKRLPLLVRRAEAERDPVVAIQPDEDVTFPFGLTRRRDTVRAYVTIIEGCNDFCTFCIVPYTRGHERLRRRAEILDEVRALAECGYKEVHLLGQIVNHYHDPDRKEYEFADLLAEVNAITGIERVRFASPHPRHVTARQIAAIRDLPKVCKHLHLPAQSGSTRVLRAMRRRYTREEYLDLVARVREAVPGIGLSTDLIVGFPGETASEFEETLTLVQTVQYDNAFSFKYSPRPNTYATKRLTDEVSESDKSLRLNILQALQRRIQTASLRRHVGTVRTVLVEGAGKRNPEEYTGRTDTNLIVNFPATPANVGTLLPVRIVAAGPNSLRGEPVCRLDKGAAPPYIGVSLRQSTG